MADHDITLGETHRMAAKALSAIETLPDKYVLRREYEKDQNATDRKIGDVATDLARTDTKVEGIQKEQDALEKERQNQAAARRWQIFLLFAGPVIATIISLWTIQQGQTP